MTEAKQSPIQPDVPAGANSSTKANAKVKLLVGLLIFIALAGTLAVWWISAGGSEEKRVVKEFVTALHAGDLKTARALCTADIDTAELGVFTKQMPDWGAIHDLDGLVAFKRGDRTEVGGRIDFDRLTKTFNGTVIKEGQAFKVQAFKFE